MGAFKFEIGFCGGNTAACCAGGSRECGRIFLRGRNLSFKAREISRSIPSRQIEIRF